MAFLAGATQGILSTVRVEETTDEASERLAGEAHKYADDLIQSERAGSPIGQNDQPGLTFSGAGEP